MQKFAQISKSPNSAVRPAMPARWARVHRSSRVSASRRRIISSCNSSHSGRTTWWPSALPAGSLIGSSAVSSAAHGAHDIAEADAAPLARQAIAAARAADADQDAVPHQLLQNRFEIAARDALALGDLGRAHRRPAAIIGDVEHRLDREQQLLGQPHHAVSPGQPKLAAARGRAGSSATVRHAPAAGATTSCGERSPRAMVRVKTRLASDRRGSRRDSPASMRATPR